MDYNNYVIIGSSAIKASAPEIPFREPSDLDVWVCDESLYAQFSNLEVKRDMKVMSESILALIPTTKGNYATEDAVYTIKCSHLGWNNPMWEKHKADILYLKAKGCVILPELYTALVSHWKLHLGAKEFLSLNKNKVDFFTDKVEYVYDHDWLHEQVAFPNEPTYKKCLVDGKDVLIDREKFDKLSYEEQVSMFREEITVIAIERYMVNPDVARHSWMQAYPKAFKKTVTQLTKGWATDFIINNIDKLVKPKYNYFEHALAKVNY